jgi:hypothetical protein
VSPPPVSLLSRTRRSTSDLSPSPSSPLSLPGSPPPGQQPSASLPPPHSPQGPPGPASQDSEEAPLGDTRHHGGGDFDVFLRRLFHVNVDKKTARGLAKKKTRTSTPAGVDVRGGHAGWQGRSAGKACK